MRFVIDIDYPPEKMETSRKRMAARERFKYVDQVPVGFCLVPRYFAPVFGIPYQEIFKDAEAQYYWLLQFTKYRLENVPEDTVCCGLAITVGPYFDNVIDADAFGAEVIWPENETLQACPTIRTVEQMESFEIPPTDAGLWGRVRDWWLEMKELAGQTRLTFGGREGRVELGQLGISGIGPHMIAIDLAGVDFYWWMLEYPEACHRFLGKITRGLIRTEEYYRTLDPRPRTCLGLAEDSSQIMSPKAFREFVVPYDRMLYETISPPGALRSMHMCGKSAHLHKALVEDLKVNSFDAFGYQVPPNVAAENLGGKMLLSGNINPMLMRNGSKQEVKQACLEALEAMAPCGGLLLGDGANVCPGTPLENLAVFTEAAEEFGLADGKLPQ